MAASPLVLVTGASGYIATHVIQQLQQDGYRVRGTVRCTKNKDNIQFLYSLCPEAKYPLELVEAELTKAEGWLEAVEGCSYVIHIASPNLYSSERDIYGEIITAAIEGTVNVLRACKETSTIKRVVLTSSVVAIFGFNPDQSGNKTYTEEDWGNIENCSMAYIESKVRAEKAAWDFVAKLTENERFELAVIHPGIALGPVLNHKSSFSTNILKAMLEREYPLIIGHHYPVTDVRDVAAAHITALTNPDAVGNRHIISSRSMWMSDIAKILARDFKPQGYSVPTWNVPYFFMWILSWFDASVASLLPRLGFTMHVDNSRMRNVLGISPRRVEDAILDMAYSMIENGMVKKASRYQNTGRK